MSKTASQIKAEIAEALREPDWRMAARLSSDDHEDPAAQLDRLALAIERRFAGSVTMKEADYPTHRLMVKAHDFDAVKKFADDWLYSNATPARLPAATIGKGRTQKTAVAPKAKKT